MVSAVLNERRHSGGFLVSEANGQRSTDQVTLKQQASNFQGSASPIMPAGVVMGLIATAAAAYLANGGNTGNFTCGAITPAVGDKLGVYNVEFIAPTVYNVYDPTGAFVAEGKTGVAFSAGGLGFTITAGGTPAVAGDGATITVAASADAAKYAPVNLTGTDGTAVAAAILFNETDASAGDRKGTVVIRSAEVNGSELIYPASATANQIATLNAQLTALGIIVR